MARHIHRQVGEDAVSTEYTFCEPVTASGFGRWHIRPLTSAGRKLGGGVDTAEFLRDGGSEAGWWLGCGRAGGAIPARYEHRWQAPRMRAVRRGLSKGDRRLTFQSALGAKLVKVIQ